MKLKTCTLAVLLAAWSCTAQPDTRRQTVSTPDAPAAIGPYSQAIRAGNTLYVSGQIAIDPETGQLVPGGIEAQTHRVMQNVEAILRAAGFSFQDVVQSQVFLSDLQNYAAMNRVYGTYFRDAPPARAAVQVARLPLGALVEIMVTAVKNK